MSIQVSWRAVQGDVLLPATTAAWLADTLALLVTVIHHPEAPLDGQDWLQAARDVRESLDELKLAADTAYGQQSARLASGELDPDDVPVDMRLTRSGAEVRIAPGAETVSIVLLLDVFAGAVLGEEDRLRDARGALAYAAAALVKDLQGLTPEADSSRDRLPE
jgi:hypothetical protein